MDAPPPFSIPGVRDGVGHLVPSTAGWGRWFLLAAAAVAVTWLPLLALCLSDPEVLRSFFDDWVLHTRVWISVPILVLLQPLVASRLLLASRHLSESGLLPQSEWAQLVRDQERLGRLRDSAVVPVVAILLAMLASLIEPFYPLPHWRSAYAPQLWFLWVSGPIVRMLLFLWLWRITLWGLYLYRVSRLELRLLNTHPDARGGLAILGDVLSSYAWLTFAIAAPVAAQARYVLGPPSGASFMAYMLPLAIVGVVCTSLIFGPLLAFSRRLRLAKLRDEFAFSSLAGRQAAFFQRTWFDGPITGEVIKVPDFSSVEDLQSTYERAHASMWIPFHLRPVLVVAGGAFWVAIPILAIDHRLVEVVTKILHAIG